jgi:hypothetical protein
MSERTQLEARLLSAAELEVVNASRLPAIKQASDERFGESKSAQAVAESGVWGMLAPWRAEFSVRQFGGPVTCPQANSPERVEGPHEELLSCQLRYLRKSVAVCLVPLAD